MDYEARFWGYVDQTARCWLWTGCVVGWGYGQFWDGRRKVQAHRYAYQLRHGPLPPGKVIDHLCRTPACVNPDHLQVVTTRINVLRGVGPSAVNARRTHCKRGHPLAGDNLIVSKKTGYRNCRACVSANSRRHARAKEQEQRRQKEAAGLYVRAPRGAPSYVCKRGHLVTDENAHWQGRSRSCRECRRLVSSSRSLS